MAMIKVVKGEKELIIPAGALSVYVSAGWSKVENKDSRDSKEKNTRSKDLKQDLEEIQSPEEEEESEEPEELEEESEEEYIEVDPEELLAKPLGDLDFEELQIAAEYLGLDTKELTTAKALRAAIKKAQK